MAFEFRLPDIGEGVAEGEIVKWFVAEGDRVARDQPMVEVLTDKANVEIPAPRAGTILKILAKEGETVPVESVLVVIGEEGERATGGGRETAEADEPRSAARETQAARAEEHAAAAAVQAAGAAKAAPVERGRSRTKAPRAKEGEEGAAQADPGEQGTQAASAPRAVKAGVREQPKAPRGPVRQVEREEAEARREARPDGGGPRAGSGDGTGGGKHGARARRAEEADERRPRRISPGDRVLAMPGVRKFAREHGVDLTRIEPSGSHGHILRQDVERFLASTKAAPAAAAAHGAAAKRTPALQEVEAGAAAGAPPTPHTLPPSARRREPGGPEEELIPYRGVRRQIGKKMAQSVYTAPHYTYVEEVDAGALVALRREAQPMAQERGVKLTYLPFIVKALVPCLRAFPLLNAVLDEEGQQIRLKKRYNIGIATASEEGLIVPVLKDVDQLSVLEIATEILRLSDAARDRSITIEELKGSTFTITSLGAMGGLLATPIINFPEVAILGVHAIKQKPVVKDGAVVAGHVMNLSLSFDHRVVDGAVGAQFTRMLVRYLENPSLLLLEG